MRKALPSTHLLHLCLLLLSFRMCVISARQDIPREEKDTVKWYSFNEGHAKAVGENKILLVNISTDLCYGCQLMKKHTYSHQGVIDTLNKYFVCVYLNPDVANSYLLNGNLVTSKELIKYLFVDEQVAYPTALFWLHPESEEKHCVHSGFMEPPRFLKLLAAAIESRPLSFLGISLKVDGVD